MNLAVEMFKRRKNYEKSVKRAKAKQITEQRENKN